MSKPPIHTHATIAGGGRTSSALTGFSSAGFPQVSMTRRQLLAGLGLTVLGAACSSGVSRVTTPPSGLPGSIESLIADSSRVSVLGTGADAPPMNPGENRLGVVLVTPENKVVEGGTANVWIAKETTEKATGPFSAQWYPLTGYDKTHDRSPRSPLPGVYATEIELPTPGIWNVAVTVASGSQRFGGTGALQVTSDATTAQLGSKAISVPTPVATSVAKIREICTRTPVDDMHYISLDDALSNGRPTVISFATPLLCTTRTCGPVVDEQLLAFQHTGKERANFIHVEEFVPGRDFRPPPATAKNLSQPFKAWGLDTDPWLVIADAQGIIRFRCLGVIAAAEIERALRPLL